MKKSVFRFLSILLIMTFCCLPASATSIPTPSESNYISCYTLASSGKLYVYSDAALSQKTGGYISCGSDECRILAVSGNAVYVSYPRDSGGRRCAWAPASAFTRFNFNNVQIATASAKITTYRRISGSSYGSVSRGDKTYVLGASNGYTQLVYPVGSGWKMAFITTANANSSLKYDGSGSGGNSPSSNLLKDGTYVMVPRCAPDSAVEVSNSSYANGAAIQIWGRAFQNGKIIPTQTVRVENVGNNAVILYNGNSGKAIDVDCQRKDAGAVLHQWDLPASDKYSRASTTWYVKDAGNGYLTFINKNSGLALDITNASSANGSRGIQYTPNNSAAQQFKLYPEAYFNQNSGSSAWDMPMKNAYCTWRSYSNMSWGSYNNNAGDRDYHLGIDIYGTNGTVYAAADGKVVAASASNSGANGRYIVIQHTLSGRIVYSFYAHLKSINVSNGQTVSRGQNIATAGGSGYGSNSYYGTHLHFAVADTFKPGTYYGYATRFSGNKTTFNGVTFYNPVFVVDNDRLPD